MIPELEVQQEEVTLLYTMAEAAEQLRISRQFLYVLVEQYQIPTVYLGRARRVRRDDLIAFVNQLAAMQ